MIQTPLPPRSAEAEAPPDPVRVLVVDDSVLVRGAVSRLLDAEPDLTVVGTAGDGRQALAALSRAPADVVVLDVEMPEMDGLTALPRILAEHPGTRVVMLSTHGGRGASVTFHALALGAADFIAKPRVGEAGAPGPSAGAGAYAAELTGKVRALGRTVPRFGRGAARPAPPTAARAAVASAPVAPAPGAPARVAPAPPVAPARIAPASSVAPALPAALVAVPAQSPPRGLQAPRSAGGTGAGGGDPMPRPAPVLLIASSTGGPIALAELFGALPAPLDVPVLVTQHMPPNFTRLLAARLTSETGHACAEARDGDVLRAGQVYIAPGDYHLLVERSGGTARVRLTQDPLVQHCRPAADPMFASAVAAYGPGTLAVVLTGMGHDGRDGAAEVVRQGGRVLAQDEATSVVWGMPGAVAQAGLAAAVWPVPRIAQHVAACCGSRATARPPARGPARAAAAPPTAAVVRPRA